MTYDDLRFDAEIIVERHGCARFDREALAEFLGVHPDSVFRMIKAGGIPAPHHYEETNWSDGKRNEIAIWTPEQVVEMLVNAKPNARRKRKWVA